MFHFLLYQQHVLTKGKLFKTIKDSVDSLVARLIPCLLLLCLTAALVRALIDTQKRRNRLKVGSPRDHSNDQGSDNLYKSSPNQQDNRTNQMLVGVLVLFLVTQLPPGTLVFLYGIGIEPTKNVDKVLWIVFSLLALLNASLNIIIYYTMSSNYRSTFKAVFFPIIQPSIGKLTMEQNTSQHVGQSSTTGRTVDTAI